MTGNKLEEICTILCIADADEDDKGDDGMFFLSRLLVELLLAAHKTLDTRAERVVFDLCQPFRCCSGSD
ncbi:hypothetical protein QVD17_01343 [Tagetes erecta]|uniref:Uncharacterized protein n=1 Tax=Tagetes erecta TaxID=13708 RepID=A0AAD8L679_TARER|nr:hypothetical protein QVD17_01343 [Tagetes erecta]